MTYKITNRQQAQFDELIAFHFQECNAINWKELEKEPFPKKGYGPNEIIWADRNKKYSPSEITQKIGLSRIIMKYIEINQSRGRKKDIIIYKNWEEKYPFIKEILSGNENAWRQAIRIYANFHKNLDIAKGYSLYVHDHKTIEFDIYLNSLDMAIPNHIEKVTKRGHIRYHPMPKTKRYELYKSYVYSCINKIINDAFAVLPCQTIFLNGLNGTYENHYPILSMVIERKLHHQERCPIKTISSHRTMVVFKKRSGFNQLSRVYSPKILFPEEN